LKQRYKKQSNIYLIDESFFTFDLLNLADCLITDYSGVYFDFLNLKKEIIFYCYDLKKYLSKDRKFYFNYFDTKFTPGKKIFYENELIQEIKTSIKKSKKKYNKKKLLDANLKFNEIPVGQSSKLVYKFINNKITK